MDGLEATRRLVAMPDPPRVIVLMMFDADEYVARALADGAAGFLLKETRPEDDRRGRTPSCARGTDTLAERDR